jgi:hypothetical protein
MMKEKFLMILFYTLNTHNTMKAKKSIIRQIIKESIQEVLKEIGEVPGVAYISKDDPRKEDKIKIAKQQKQSYQISNEAKLTEMSARTKYTITDPEKFDKATFGSDATKVESIFNFLRDLADKGYAGDSTDYARMLTINVKKIDPETDEPEFKRVSSNLQASVSQYFRKLEGANLITKVEVSPAEVKDKRERLLMIGAPIVGDSVKAKKFDDETGEEIERPEKRSLASIFGNDDPGVMMGGDFEDNFDDGILSFDKDGNAIVKRPGEEAPEEKTSKNSGKGSDIRGGDAKSQAANFLIDTDDDLQKLLNISKMAGTRSSRGSGGAIKEDVDLTISAKRDYDDKEKSRIDRAKGSIDSLVQQYVEKIKTEKPEIQRAILELLAKKIGASNANLYKKIVRGVGLAAVDAAAAEKVEIPLSSDDEIEDLVGDSEEEFDVDPADAPEKIKGDDELKEEDETNRLQELAGL